MIKTQIIPGDSRIGDRPHTENNLATAYNVSRTVIREAMNILQEKG